jgi:hypothetical protein
MSDITPEQIAEYQRHQAQQAQANRQACIEKINTLADSLGFVVVAMPQLAEVSPGNCVIRAAWGVAEKAQ